MPDTFTGGAAVRAWVSKLDSLLVEGYGLIGKVYEDRYGGSPYVAAQIGKIARARNRIAETANSGWGDLPGPLGDH